MLKQKMRTMLDNTTLTLRSPARIKIVAKEYVQEVFSSPSALALGAFASAALLIGGIAYSDSSTTATTNDCANGPYKTDGVSAAIRQNLTQSQMMLYESMNTNTSKYFDSGGDNDCLKFNRLQALDLSLSMPDFGLNAAASALVVTFRNKILQKACDLASGTLNDVIGKYNGIIGNVNGFVDDTNGAVNGMLQGTMANATSSLQNTLTNRAAQWTGGTAVVTTGGTNTGSIDPVQFCADTTITTGGLTNLAQSAVAKANAQRALYGTGCMESLSKSCSDGLYYQQADACRLVPQTVCDGEDPPNCHTIMVQYDPAMCSSTTNSIATQENALNAANNAINQATNQVGTAVNNNNGACQTAVDSLAK